MFGLFLYLVLLPFLVVGAFWLAIAVAVMGHPGLRWRVPLLIVAIVAAFLFLLTHSPLLHA
jgi:hypothetical protein